MIEINKILTIAISTISNNPDILLKKILLELPNISKNISFLIVLQGNISNLDFIDYPKDRINIIFSETTGLSLSRNIAINSLYNLHHFSRSILRVLRFPAAFSSEK